MQPLILYKALLRTIPTFAIDSVAAAQRSPASGWRLSWKGMLGKEWLVHCEICGPTFHSLAKKSLPKPTMQCASSGIGIATIDEFEVAWCHSCGKLAAGAIEEVTSSTPFQARSVSKPVFAFPALSLLQKPPAGRLLTAETR